MTSQSSVSVLVLSGSALVLSWFGLTQPFGGREAVANAGRNTAAPAITHIELQKLGTFQHGGFEQGAAEIVAYDPQTRRLFVVNGENHCIDMLDVADPVHPELIKSIALSAYGKSANSVAVRDGIVVAAVEAQDKQAPGQAVFFNTDGDFVSAVTVGALPDMVTISPDGRTVLVANEGEPNNDYTVDPEGSVSLIDISRGPTAVTDNDVTTLHFRDFNDRQDLPPGVRVFGPNATVAQDFEPEYIAVSKDSRTAWVTLQENNALAKIDVRAKKIVAVVDCGASDHSVPGHGLDVSDKDGTINIANWPVKGLYQPDSIAAFSAHGATFLVTANEGDARDYKGFSEETRVAELTLDPTAFPNASDLQSSTQLGRLKTTKVNGDLDHDGDVDEIYSFGTRSFSIWDADGRLVYDSGDQFERILASVSPGEFNSTNNENRSFDDRSDDKGPEPEGVAVGMVLGRTLAFIGLERMSGIMVFDVSEPRQPKFLTFSNSRDFAGNPANGSAGDLAPEGLLFIAAEDSPIGAPLLVAAFEVSGTTTVFKIVAK